MKLNDNVEVKKVNSNGNGNDTENSNGNGNGKGNASGTSTGTGTGTGSIINMSSYTLNRTFNKIVCVQSVLNENNGDRMGNVSKNDSPNTIVRKIKDFGMIGSVNNAAEISLSVVNSRKYPLQESAMHSNSGEGGNECKSNGKTEDKCCPKKAANKKLKLSKELRASLKDSKKSAKENASPFAKIDKTTADLRSVIKRQGTPGRKGLPLPHAVARRNARERNRVKQVNNGFAALRERIPDEVAKAFEAHNCGRSSSKKFSKVETLRMAVEYIRSLERLLGIDISNNSDLKQPLSNCDTNFIFIKDEFDVFSPLPSEVLDDSFTQCDTDIYLNDNAGTTITNEPTSSSSNIESNETYSDVTLVNGIQCIRIPATPRTYDFLETDIFTNSFDSAKKSILNDELLSPNCSSPNSIGPSVSASLATIELLYSPSTKVDVRGVKHNKTTTNVAASIMSSTTFTKRIERVNEGRFLPGSNLLLHPVPKAQSTAISAISAISAPSSTQLSTKASSSTSLQQSIAETSATTATTGTTATTIIIRSQPSELSPAPNAQLADLKQKGTRNQQLLHQQNGICSEPAVCLKTHTIKREEYKDTTTEDDMSIFETQEYRRQSQQQKLYMNSFEILPSLENQPAPISSARPQENLTCNTFNISEFADNNGDQLNGNQNIFTEDLTLKKDFENVILDSVYGSDMSEVVLSDENLIDWWQAHTPKSDGTP